MENKLIEFIEFINSTCTIHQNKLHVDLLKKIFHKRAKEYALITCMEVFLRIKNNANQQKGQSSFNGFDTFLTENF